jgi:MFS family permease
MSQGAGGLVALALAVLTLTDQVQAWQVVLASLLSMGATTFDNPTRTALIGSMVPPHQLPQAFALVNPCREIAVLVGPGLAGVMIAVGGPGVVHAFDSLTYAAMIGLLFFIKTPTEHLKREHKPIFRAIIEGARYVGHRKIILLLMSLDLSAMVFGAYRGLRRRPAPCSRPTASSRCSAARAGSAASCCSPPAASRSRTWCSRTRTGSR